MRHLSLDTTLETEIAADTFARTTMPGRPPVADGSNPGKILLTSKTTESIVDGLPDAEHFRVNLTAPPHRTAAGAVHQAFGAAGHRT